MSGALVLAGATRAGEGEVDDVEGQHADGVTFTVSSGNPRYDAFVRLRLDMTIIDDVVAVESLLGALGVLSGERSVPQWRRPSMEPDARRTGPARSLGPLARPTH